MVIAFAQTRRTVCQRQPGFPFIRTICSVVLSIGCSDAILPLNQQLIILWSLAVVYMQQLHAACIFARSGKIQDFVDDKNQHRALMRDVFQMMPFCAPPCL